MKHTTRDHANAIRPVTFAAALVAGIVTAWLVAWACAVVRPIDGWPNVFGRQSDEWNEAYLMPQLRLTIDAGEVFVDHVGTAVSEQASIGPVWVRELGPDDQWLFTAYPTPAEINPAKAAPWPDRSTWRIPSWAALCERDTQDVTIVTSAWGWPMYCLKGVERTQHLRGPTGLFAGTTSSFDGYWLAGGVPVRNRITPNPAPRVRNLPLAPIWGGLVVNSLVYGAAWLCAGLLATRGLRTVRSAIRRRRGQCTRCAYDLGGLAPGAACPECGHAPAPAATP